jgi:hypothetical protein
MSGASSVLPRSDEVRQARVQIPQPSWQSETGESRGETGESRDETAESRGGTCESPDTIAELAATSYELRATFYLLRSTRYELRDRRGTRQGGYSLRAEVLATTASRRG